ncbi:MAG: rod shape-determining protein RodA [Alphaproteobacteria bacterium]|nr:rod shape-determining protein RodA [Alphaproteobacteria bacterium]
MTLQEKKIFFDIDKTILFLYLCLIFIGLTAVFIVEHNANTSFFSTLFSFNNNFSKQFYFIIFSFIIAFIIILVESNLIVSFAYLSYGIGLFLMILTFVIGENINGSNSWISIGGVLNLQPAELCKVFTSLALAKYYSSMTHNANKKEGIKMIALIIVFIPAILSILQHELGQAIIYLSFMIALYREGFPASILIVSICFAILVLASLIIEPNTLVISLIGIALFFFFFNLKKIKKNKKLGWIIAIILIFSVFIQRFTVPYIFNNLLECYQSTRIYSLIGKDYDCTQNKKRISKDLKLVSRKPDDYNVRQSMIAVGSGGFLGKGLFKSTQTKGKYVPAQHTDFIFTSIGEAFGFLGCSIFLIIYLTFILRLLNIAESQRSTFARVYGYSIVGFFFMQFAINVNMTIGLFPVIGITLPFISYGGSSLFTFTILLFILLKFDIDKQKVFR